MKVLRDTSKSYAPADVSAWDIYNAFSTTGVSCINLVPSSSANLDAVMWAQSAYSPVTIPNFVMKLTVETTSLVFPNPPANRDELATQGYTIVFADSSSRVIPAVNGVIGEEFGVDWASFTGLAIFGGVGNLYSYFSSTVNQYGSTWPECNGPGSRSGQSGCFGWEDMFPGKKHYLIVAVEDARYVRITVCADGVSPCRVSQGYDYFLETPLTDLTGPIYFGVAGRTNGKSGVSYTDIYAVDFYTPTVTCSNNCNGRGFCMDDGSCICHSGFSGVDCAVITCTPTCMNGGTCIAPDICQCAPGFAGTDCTISKPIYFPLVFC